MSWQSEVIKQFPKISPEYRASLVHPETETALRRAGVLDHPLRLAHFFATVGVESGGMTVLRENMNYSAKRISEIFGVGKHSAAISPGRAQLLAGQPEKLAEAVYGIGNQRKAKDLGNTMPGDGWTYRGIGPFQLTGRTAILSATARLGLSDHLDLLKPSALFASAALFWTDRDLSALADRDDARGLRKRVNGGYNGFEEYAALKDRLYRSFTSEPLREAVIYDSETAAIQVDLLTLGFNLKVDGVYGKQTEEAVRGFQRINGLKVDGIAGEATKAVIRQRLEGNSTSPATVDERDVIAKKDRATQGTGTALTGLGAAGEMLMSTSKELGGLELDSPIFKALPPILLVIGIVLILIPIVRGK